MAAGGASAAAGETADHRRHRRRYAIVPRTISSRPGAAVWGARLDRKSHGRGRGSVGGGTPRAVCRICRGVRAAEGRCHRHLGTGSASGEAGDIGDPDCVRGSFGTGRHRDRCEPRAARGQRHGLSLQQTDYAGKRFELFREVVPQLRRLAILGNVRAPGAMLEMGEVQATARALGLEVVTAEIRRAEDIAPTFRTLAGRADALYVCPDALVTTNSIRINILAAGARLPTTYVFREDVAAGGLMSYGPSFPHVYRRAADYVDKILRGAKPADLPIEQPTKFDLVVNLITAQALGLEVPPTLLARADEVIE
jgi:ABC transporter substrate binding protein